MTPYLVADEVRRRGRERRHIDAILLTGLRTPSRDSIVPPHGRFPRYPLKKERG
jgi:hypothetical protein